jgi:8-amino-7-oxononanoate synthase
MRLRARAPARTVCGTARSTRAEAELADWLQAPRALLFGSGYLANLAVVQACSARRFCVQDRLTRQLIDAARLAGCAFKRYPHADAERRRRQLASQARAPLLASDGVFDGGDVAPLRELVRSRASSRRRCTSTMRTASACWAKRRRGSIDAAGLGINAVPLRLVTFGKALGSVGAAVIGDADLIAHLAETARPYIYTTAMPPAQAAAP